MVQERSALHHRQLGPRRGAGRGAQDGHVLAAPRRHLPVVEFGVPGVRFLAEAVKLGDVHETRVLVLAHAARIAIDDVADARRLVDQVEQLVHLLLVLGDDDLGLGVVDQVADLVAHGVLVDAQRHGAERVRRHFAPDPFRPVVADDPDRVAAFEPEPLHAEGHEPDAIMILRPGEGVPDTEFLLAHGHFVRPVAGVVSENLGERVVDADVRVLGRPFRLGRHQATFSPAGPEGAALMDSSSSPR